MQPLTPSGLPSESIPLFRPQPCLSKSFTREYGNGGGLWLQDRHRFQVTEAGRLVPGVEERLLLSELDHPVDAALAPDAALLPAAKRSRGVARARVDVDVPGLDPLRDRLHHLVEKRFRSELSKCEGCKLCK